MRRILSSQFIFKNVLALFLISLVTAFAHASTVTYDLTLTPTSGGSFAGTGVLVLKQAPANGNNPSSIVSSLTFTIDGQTFTGTSSNFSAISYDSTTQQITDITFAQQIGTTPNRYDLQTTSRFSFYYNDEQSVETGSITSSLASAATPEPSSLILLGTGLCGAAGSLMRRRIRKG